MPNFNERLAEIADMVRGLPQGKGAALALMQLASDIDTYLEEQRGARYDRWPELLQKWNEFTVMVADDAHRYRKEQLVIERRKLARAIAADPRWTGGYVDALALLTEAPPAGA
jgi:hypothetical protein